MSIKVVTDSVADLPSALVRELGITVIPLNVRFGEEVYRDGIDLTSEQFYQRLTTKISQRVYYCSKTILLGG